ncbi:MAG: hypothetical protein RL268_1894 [Pseudomonadota bacterium]|jgi:hypothetical protein
MTDHLTEARAEGAVQFRQRCAAIMRSSAARGRFKQAQTLALDTDVTAADAIKVLSSAPLDAESSAAPGMAISDAAAAQAWAKAVRDIQ